MRQLGSLVNEDEVSEEWRQYLISEKWRPSINPDWAISIADAVGACNDCNKVTTLKLKDKAWLCLSCYQKRS